MKQTRRGFFRGIGMLGAMLALREVDADPALPISTTMADSRADWAAMLQRIALPILTNLANRTLRANMPVECPMGNLEDRKKVTHLEALGRTLAGVAPWLELAGGSPAESAQSDAMAQTAHKALASATDSSSPDFINFTAGNQNLVDAAFLSHAFLRAPNALWLKLDKPVQDKLIDAIKSTRTLKAGQNNWVLFPAMIETFLAGIGQDWKPDIIDTALADLRKWYAGDGTYGDGPDFHDDYYNSFVIHPFLIDIIDHIGKVTDRWSADRNSILTRARRYAAIQERQIAEDGSYPIIGRSLAYRCGAFQLLAQMSLRNELPKEISPAQVRSALTAVISKTMLAPETFDTAGFLKIGIAGHQPDIAESYISTGSLYMCTLAFLPLGLPESDDFWKSPAANWTAKKVWSGQNFPADHALRDPREALVASHPG